MNFFMYSISGFLIAKFFLEKNNSKKIPLGLACIAISFAIRYEAVKTIDWGMFFHLSGVLIILIFLDFLSKKR
ncbi:MAG: hypothetical protein AAB176_16020 [Pseudomonadota bacterium]